MLASNVARREGKGEEETELLGCHFQQLAGYKGEYKLDQC